MPCTRWPRQAHTPPIIFRSPLHSSHEARPLTVAGDARRRWPILYLHWFLRAKQSGEAMTDGRDHLLVLLDIGLAEDVRRSE